MTRQNRTSGQGLHQLCARMWWPSCRLTVCILAALSVPLLTGCQDDVEITRYSVPTAPAEEASVPGESTETVQTRLLGAIVPQEEQTWFFKLMGLADDVEGHVEEFRKFVGSLRFSDGEPPQPEWTLPDGWTEERGSGMRFATLHVGEDPSSPEISVIPLPPTNSDEQQWILDNINRWRRQVGLGSITAGELSEETEQIALNDGSATVVNLSGEASTSPMNRAPFADHPPIGESGAPFADSGKPSPRPSPSGRGSEPVGNELTYNVPEGWSQGRVGGMRKAAFEVSDGGKKAEITVIDLPGSAGDLLANVNRWRGQIGLQSTTPAELDEVVEPMEIAGTAGQYVELIGSDEAILGAIVNHAGRTWFFKLMGEAELAEKEKQRFRAFVQSVTFR